MPNADMTDGENIKNNETNIFTFFHQTCLHLPYILFNQLKITLKIARS